jgi:hypothetical protein
MSQQSIIDRSIAVRSRKSLRSTISAAAAADRVDNGLVKCVSAAGRSTEELLVDDPAIIGDADDVDQPAGTSNMEVESDGMAVAGHTRRSPSDWLLTARLEPGDATGILGSSSSLPRSDMQAEGGAECEATDGDEYEHRMEEGTERKLVRVREPALA